MQARSTNSEPPAFGKRAPWRFPICRGRFLCRTKISDTPIQAISAERSPILLILSPALLQHLRWSTSTLPQQQSSSRSSSLFILCLLEDISPGSEGCRDQSSSLVRRKPLAPESRSHP